MRPFDNLLFMVLGFLFWIGGTVLYRFRGHKVFETSDQQYWINFALTPIVTTAVCILILRWRHTPASDWAFSALLIALPGMFGEAILLSRFAQFMPRMRPETAGRYGAFLFATYALFLAVAAFFSARAANSQ